MEEYQLSPDQKYYNYLNSADEIDLTQPQGQNSFDDLYKVISPKTFNSPETLNFSNDSFDQKNLDDYFQKNRLENNKPLLSDTKKTPSLTNVDNTWRDEIVNQTQNLFAEKGMAPKRAQKMAVKFWGNDNKIGVMDFLGFGEILGMQESLVDIEEGRPVQGTIFYILNALGATLGAAAVGKLVKQRLNHPNSKKAIDEFFENNNVVPQQ